MLPQLIKEKMVREGLSMRQAAKEMGLNSHMTLINNLNGKQMTIDTANLLSDWLCVSLATVLENPSHAISSQEFIAVIFKAQPELEILLADIAGKIQAGDLSTNDLREIVEFAAFRLQQARKHREMVGLMQNEGE